MIKEQVIKKIVTPQFGELEVLQDYIFSFENGILGFENLKDYVLISDEATDPFKWLISIDEPEIGFPIINPYFIDADYKFGKNYEASEYVPFVVVTLGNKAEGITANLKAPIVLNVESQHGEQIILSHDKYLPNHKLGSKSKKKV